MSNQKYQNSNFLSAGQRKIFKNLQKIDAANTVLLKPEIGKQGYFASAVSLDGLNSKRAAILTMLTDALTLTKALMNDELYDANISSVTSNLRTKVSTLIDTVQGVLNSSLGSQLNAEGVKNLAINLNNCFDVPPKPGNAIDSMVTYGVFAGVYKKVVGMMKNYNPYSRTEKAKTGKKGLGEMKETPISSKPFFTTIAKDLTDKTKDVQWIYAHLNTSLPICCIDKLICIMNDTASIHTLLSSYVKSIDKLNNIVGGTPLSYFSYISFYFNYGIGTLEDCQKLRLKIDKDEEGGWLLNGVVYPERLNIKNEIKRSIKSSASGDGNNRAYEVYIIAGGACSKISDELTRTTPVKDSMGYYTDASQLYSDKFQVNNGQVVERPPGDITKSKI